MVSSSAVGNGVFSNGGRASEEVRCGIRDGNRGDRVGEETMSYDGGVQCDHEDMIVKPIQSGGEGSGRGKRDDGRNDGSDAGGCQRVSRLVVFLMAMTKD